MAITMSVQADISASKKVKPKLLKTTEVCKEIFQ